LLIKLRLLGWMVMRAYIVITAESGKARDIARQVGSLPGVKMADACWGSRDIFAVVEVRESQELNKLVMDQIQRLAGVRETSTHIALD
jgi:DNA-binding Lrp family transcriptional regulator